MFQVVNECRRYGDSGYGVVRVRSRSRALNQLKGSNSSDESANNRAEESPTPFAACGTMQPNGRSEKNCASSAFNPDTPVSGRITSYELLMRSVRWLVIEETDSALDGAAHDGGAALGPKRERFGKARDYPLEPGQVFKLELGVDTADGTRGYLGLEEMGVVINEGIEWLSERQATLPLLRE